jgi:hypothetical protein
MEAPTAIPGVLATTVRVVVGFCSATLMVSVGVVIEVTGGNISGPYFFRGLSELFDGDEAIVSVAYVFFLIGILDILSVDDQSSGDD